MKEEPAPSPMHRAAQVYAGHGWPVFPCHPNDKRPLTQHGFEDASTRLAQIDEWWSKWPDAMIGVPTGKAVGAFVVDIDPKDGVAPPDLVLALGEACGVDLELTGPLTTTPRGGWHVWLAMPEEELGNRANLLKAKSGESTIDVRGEGGYVIVPPSVRHGAKAKKEGCDGGAYEWREGVSAYLLSPPEAPQELVDLILRRHEHEVTDRPEPAPAPRSPSDPGSLSGAGDRARRYALSALDAECRAVAECPSGGRNDTLNRAAYALGQLVGAGALTESAVLAALEDAAAACGLVKDDGIRSVRKTIHSGLDGGRRDPRDMSDVGTRSPGLPRAPDAPFPDSLDGSHPAAPADGKRGSRSAKRASRSGGGGNAGAPPGDGGGDGEGPTPEDIHAANAQEPQNDTGNGRRMMRWFGGDMLIVRDVGEHYWAGSHWEPQGGDEAFLRFAQETAELIADEALYLKPSKEDAELIAAAEETIGKPYYMMSPDHRKLIDPAAKAAIEQLEKRQGQRWGFSISSGNSNRINGMIAQAAPHITVAPEALDAEPLAINVANGTLRVFKAPDPECPDPDATRLRWAVRLDAHDAKDMIAKMMPVEYDPEAICPNWEAFVERFQPKPSIRSFLRAFHGYALTGLMGEQVFVYNYGLGANGKTTFMEAVARLQGSYAKVLPAEALTGDNQRRGDQATPEFARLPGARLVRCAELPRGQGFRESTIKMLTGGESMLVRHLHERFFEMTPSFKAIGSGNDRPSIGGVDEGIWRRMKLVPWEVTIPPAERRPMEKVLAEFKAEWPGILNWLLDGLLDYLENGLVIPPEIQAATDSYRADMDPVGEFTAACIVPALGQDVTAREAYRAYVAWCHANSVKPFAEKTFAGIMVQKGYEKESGRIRKYKNVALKDVPDDPEEQQKYPDRWGGV